MAQPGYEIVRAALHRPVPYQAGFAHIEGHLRQLGRPRHALCAVELRLPAPRSFDGFAAFNAGYQQLLADWDLHRDGINPVARTNVAPAVLPPSEPSLYAFSYTVPAPDPSPRPTFIVAGAGELTDQAQLHPGAVVRPGETSLAAMTEKAQTVLAEMQARVQGLGVSWADATAVDVYTEQFLHPYLRSHILDAIAEAAVHGIHWFLSRPPIANLEFEMDLRGIRVEQRL